MLGLVLAGCSGDDGEAAGGAAAPDRVTTALPTATPTPEPPAPGDPGSPAASPSGGVPAPTPSAPAGTASRDPGEVAPAAPVPGSPAAPPAPPAPEQPSVPRPPVDVAPAPGLPPCDPGVLTIADADAVFGPDDVRSLFSVRTSGPDCELPAAVPQVEVLDAAGRPLGTATPGGGLPPGTGEPLTLSRTTSLSFYVSSRRDGLCTPAASVRVRLGGTSAPLTTATALQVCDLVLSAGSLQRLATGE